MPIDTEEFMRMGRELLAKNGAKPVRIANGETGDPGDSKWGLLFTRHPEGGGPFNGRDNALTALIGFLRALSVKYDEGLGFCQLWNRLYCDPPIPEQDVHEKAGRKWWEWQAGGMEQTTPEDFQQEKKPQGSILTVAQLLALADDPDKQFKWIAQDLIQEDGITVISAPSGNGKTWLAMELCRHLTRHPAANYGPFLDKYHLPIRGCLYLDEENGEPTMALRVKRLGFEQDNTRFLSWSDSGLRLEHPADRKAIIDVCRDTNTGVVIFDSLKAFHTRDENSATEMRRVGEWLREIMLSGVCVIALHHDKKSGGFDGPEAEKTRGSGDITAFSQSVLGLQQKGSLYHLSKRKIRGAENDYSIITYALARDPSREDGIRLSVADAQRITETEREAATQQKADRVREAIRLLEERGEPVTSKAISSLAKMSLRDVTEAREYLDSDD